MKSVVKTMNFLGPRVDFDLFPAQVVTNLDAKMKKGKLDASLIQIYYIMSTWCSNPNRLKIYMASELDEGALRLAQIVSETLMDGEVPDKRNTGGRYLPLKLVNIVPAICKTLELPTEHIDMAKYNQPLRALLVAPELTPQYALIFWQMVAEVLRYYSTADSSDYTVKHTFFTYCMRRVVSMLKCLQT